MGTSQEQEQYANRSPDECEYPVVDLSESLEKKKSQQEIELRLPIKDGGVSSQIRVIFPRTLHATEWNYFKGVLELAADSIIKSCDER